MISAAETLEGHSDALFLRGKGPGEVLLPMALWRLTGTVNELIARLPFAIAGLLMVLTVYLLGRRLWSERVGLIAAGLLALNGFMVGFSRIVQYQVLVVWMSALALLCVWEWRARAALAGRRWPGFAWAPACWPTTTPSWWFQRWRIFKYQISNRKSQIANLKSPPARAAQPGRATSNLPGPRGAPARPGLRLRARVPAPQVQAAGANPTSNLQLSNLRSLIPVCGAARRLRALLYPLPP